MPRGGASLRAHSGAGIDQAHVVIDWWDRDAWTIQDPTTATLQSYTTGAGEPVAQLSFSPFGRLLDRDALPPAEAASAANGFQPGSHVAFRIRIGHHGLMPKPLASHNQPYQHRADGLLPGRHTVYHNRNRTYDPFLGRFLQHDPNATGQTLASLAFEGRLGGTEPGAFDATGWLGDGGNLYAAYGHDPVNATDPSGLMFGLLPGLMIDSYFRWEGIKGDFEEAQQGLVTSLALDAMIDGYAISQMIDVEWALDWDMSDDFYSASGGPGYDEIYSDGSVGDGPIVASIWRPHRGRSHPGGRHSGGIHDVKLHRLAKLMGRKYGARNVRFNQAFSDPVTGETWSRKRPDLQVFDKKKKHIILFELENTSRRSASDIRKFKRIAEEKGYTISVQRYDISQ